MTRKDFAYKVVNLDEEILESVRKKLAEGKDFIASAENASAEQITPGHLAWVKSFASIIESIDPHGAYYGSSSLAARWSSAAFPGDRGVEQVFANYLGVVNSLLSGKVKVVRGPNDQPGQNPFGVGDVTPEDDLVFVSMPFTEGWSNYIWEKEIMPAVAEAGLRGRRADDLFGQDVMKDVFHSIVAAPIVIADVTEKNANVFYELGIAHSYGKDVILLSQGTQYIPFDLNRFRHCVYSNDGPGYANLRKYLSNALRAARGKVEESGVDRNDQPGQNPFGVGDVTPEDDLVFVLMPFTEGWSNYIWEKEIMPAVAEAGLRGRRADDLFGQDVMKDVFHSIVAAPIVIADVTEKNANVFYELGIAHSYGKDVILLSQGTQYIPFDLNRFRHCIYSNDGPGYAYLRKYLSNALRAAVEKSRKAESI